MDIDHFDDLAVPFALGALEPAEADRMEGHCRACPSCSRLVAEASWVAGMLPFLVPSVPPPPGAKAALFARIEQSTRSGSRPEIPSTLTIPASRPLLDPPPASHRSGRSFRLPVRSPLRPRSGGSPLWSGVALPLASAAVPLVLVLALVGAWGMEQQSQAAERNGQLQSLTQQLDSLHQLTRNGGSVTTLALSAGPAAPRTADGKLFVDAETLEGVLMVKGLKDADPGATYDVWVTKSGTSVDVADLKVDKDGFGMAALNLDSPLTEYRSVRVTAKPLAVGGGSLPSGDNDALRMSMPAGPSSSVSQPALGWLDIGSESEEGSGSDPSGVGTVATPGP